jgi:hypothetical protein
MQERFSGRNARRSAGSGLFCFALATLLVLGFHAPLSIAQACSTKTAMAGPIQKAANPQNTHTDRGMATIRYKMGHLLNTTVPAAGFREDRGRWEVSREPGHR